MTLPAILPALPPKDFYLIRHGETTANRDSIIAGRLDVPLTDRGRNQASNLAHFDLPDEIALFSSPLSRALETAQLGFPGHICNQHPDLRERDWGIFEGRDLNHLPSRDSKPEQGESWYEMILRVHMALSDCVKDSGDKLPVIVCHSGVIRATRLLNKNKDSGPRPPNAIPIHFRWETQSHKEHFFEQRQST